MNPQEIIQAYIQQNGLSPQEQQSFMQELQQLSPQEQQEALAEMANSLQSNEESQDVNPDQQVVARFGDEEDDDDNGFGLSSIYKRSKSFGAQMDKGLDNLIRRFQASNSQKNPLPVKAAATANTSAKAQVVNKKPFIAAQVPVSITRNSNNKVQVNGIDADYKTAKSFSAINDGINHAPNQHIKFDKWADTDGKLAEYQKQNQNQKEEIAKAVTEGLRKREIEKNSSPQTSVSQSTPTPVIKATGSKMTNRVVPKQFQSTKGNTVPQKTVPTNNANVASASNTNSPEPYNEPVQSKGLSLMQPLSLKKIPNVGQKFKDRLVEQMDDAKFVNVETQDKPSFFDNVLEKFRIGSRDKTDYNPANSYAIANAMNETPEYLPQARFNVGQVVLPSSRPAVENLNKLAYSAMTNLGSDTISQSVKANVIANLYDKTNQVIGQTEMQRQSVGNQYNQTVAKTQNDEQLQNINFRNQFVDRLKRRDAAKVSAIQQALDNNYADQMAKQQFENNMQVLQNMYPNVRSTDDFDVDYSKQPWQVRTPTVKPK